jgi:hypothetical protein
MPVCALSSCQRLAQHPDWRTIPCILSAKVIQYTRSYLPYWRPFLHPQTEDAPCCGHRNPLNMVPLSRTVTCCGHRNPLNMAPLSRTVPCCRHRNPLNMAPLSRTVPCCDNRDTHNGNLIQCVRNVAVHYKGGWK